jgi:hypothetical protein
MVFKTDIPMAFYLINKQILMMELKIAIEDITCKAFAGSTYSDL